MNNFHSWMFCSLAGWKVNPQLNMQIMDLLELLLIMIVIKIRGRIIVKVKRGLEINILLKNICNKDTSMRELRWN